MKLFSGCSCVWVLLWTWCFVLKANCFRISIGSCHNISKIQKGFSPDIWNKIAEREPDMFIWGGDIIYPDHEPASGPELREKYEATRNLPEIQNLYQMLGQENIIGIWDDHDYGMNNGGEDLDVRNVSQQAFLDFFDVPPRSSRRKQNGVYNSHLFADDRIKIILLDNRYFKDETDGELLGRVQWNWFEEELNTLPDSVEAVLVVAGLQMIRDQWSTDVLESFSRYGNARTKLLDTISRSDAKNVFLVSGDVHYPEMSAMRCWSNVNRTQYVLPELTTSGMTHSVETYYGDFLASMFNYWYWANEFEYQYQKMYSIKRNFGELNFNFNGTDGSLSSIEAIAFNPAGKALFSENFEVSRLQSPGNGEPASCELYTRVSWVEKAVRLFVGAFPLLVVIALLIFLIAMAIKFGIRAVKKAQGSDDEEDEVLKDHKEYPTESSGASHLEKA